MRHPLPLIVALLSAAIGIHPAPAWAQPSFTEVTPTDGLWVTNADEDFWVNSVAPADVDGDGDMDLAMIGTYVVYNVSADPRLVLFMNQGPDASGNWVFTEVPVPLGDLWAGASDLAWGDYDGDGDPDLAVGSEGAMTLYRNDGGTLTPTPTVLPAYAEYSSYAGAYDLRSITWADVDNDGDLDLLVPSVPNDTTFRYETKLLRNDGSDGGDAWRFTDMGAAIDPTVHAQSAWADDDGDRDLDLFVVNVDPSDETGFIRRFRNDDGTSFVGEDLLGIKVEWGMADWGDYDSDGDLDILVAGNIQETDGSYNTVLRIYRNDGGSYSETTIPGDWLDINAATWADYDSDGDVDLLVSGNFVDPVVSEIVGRSRVYANDGGVFTDTGVFLPAPVESLDGGGSFTWFDLDGDGDLDYFVAGAYYVPGGNGLVDAQMHLYRNDAPGTNAPPTAPQSLMAAPEGSERRAAPLRGGGGTEALFDTAQDFGIELSWDAATDDHTAVAGLTYDLEVHPVGTATVATQRLPEPGNVGARTSWKLRGLPAGNYVWSVRAVDNALAAGPKAQGSFRLGSAKSPDGGPTGGGDADVGAGGNGGGGACACRAGGRSDGAPLALALLAALGAVRVVVRRARTARRA
jgi:VCBS repeat protein